MARPVTLNITAQAGADGVATVRITGPGDAWDVLDIDMIALSCTSEGLPEARLYRGDAATGILLGVAPDGLTGGFTGGGSGDRLGPSEVWSVQWTGCDPGSLCTVAVSGTQRRR